MDDEYIQDYQEFIITYLFSYNSADAPGQTKIIRTSWQEISFPGTLQVQQSIINGVGVRKTMFEKLLLAVTITFSLNLFLQVRVPHSTNTGIHDPQNTEPSITILVKKPEK
ncbi:MAG: hypothetical protein KME59_22715 [Trichormus sp. ATA11-4-KO1]|nr:hypothetical protein [Trichormus sp. ATA11-4-KO1]